MLTLTTEQTQAVNFEQWNRQAERYLRLVNQTPDDYRRFPTFIIFDTEKPYAVVGTEFSVGGFTVGRFQPAQPIQHTFAEWIHCSHRGQRIWMLCQLANRNCLSFWTNHCDKIVCINYAILLKGPALSRLWRAAEEQGVLFCMPAFEFVETPAEHYEHHHPQRP